jgi:hypothetical protein
MSNNLVAGKYIFQLTVKDNLGNTSTDTVTVNVVNDLRLSGIDQVQIYPNPAHDQVYLRVLSESTGKLSVNVYNSLGAMVQSREIDKGQGYFADYLDISRLAAGTYIIQVQIGNSKGVATKLIKQ